MTDYKEHIDLYLLNELTLSDRASFEKAVKNDPALAKALEERKKVIQLLEIQEDEKLRDHLNKTHQSLYGKEADRKTKNNELVRRIALVITVAALLAVLYLIFANLKPRIHHQLFAEYYTTYELASVPRGTTETDWAEVSRLYRRKDYTMALEYIDTLLKQKDEAHLRLAAGLCHIGLNQPTQAIEAWRPILSDPLYVEPAQWYTALAYVRLNDASAARNILQRIGKDSEFYLNAQELLDDLPK